MGRADGIFSFRQYKEDIHLHTASVEMDGMEDLNTALVVWNLTESYKQAVLLVF